MTTPPERAGEPPASPPPNTIPSDASRDAETVLARRALERIAPRMARRIGAMGFLSGTLSGLGLMLLGILVDASITGGEILPGRTRSTRLALIAAVAVLFIASGVAKHLSQRKHRYVRSPWDRRASPKRGLIFLLSPPKPPLDESLDPLCVAGVVLRPGTLDAAIMAVHSVRWNWQPILRALERHQPSLAAVYLIGSSDTQGMLGSFHALAQAKALIHLYLPHVEVVHATVPVDFENVQALITALGSAVLSLEDKDIRQDDISIDVTGGQKPTSIAGAVVTLNTDVRFQYVQTNDPYDVREYGLAMPS